MQAEGAEVEKARLIELLFVGIYVTLLLEFSTYKPQLYCGKSKETSGRRSSYVSTAERASRVNVRKLSIPSAAHGPLGIQ
jgi:hypothetical protein